MRFREALQEVNHGAAPSLGAVALAIPADKDHVVLVRSAAAHLGARIGLSTADLDDLRLAVTEACALLLAADLLVVVGETLECRFAESGGALHFTVSASVVGDDTARVESFGWNLLSALVDELHWYADSPAGRAGVHLAMSPDRRRLR